MYLIFQKYDIVNVMVKNIYSFIYVYKMLSFLKYQCFTHIFVVDNPSSVKRFAINYTMQSLKGSNYINFILQVNDSTPVKSITSIFYAANWAEREAWDMFGIFFLNHSSMQRLLVDYGFEGYPLRKDFPLSGYIELGYSDGKKRILYQKIDLVQEYRNFFFPKLWSET